MLLTKTIAPGDRPATSVLSSELWTDVDVQEAAADEYLRANAHDMVRITVSGPDLGRFAPGSAARVELPGGVEIGRLVSVTRKFARGDGFSATADYVVEARK